MSHSYICPNLRQNVNDSECINIFPKLKVASVGINNIPIYLFIFLNYIVELFAYIIYKSLTLSCFPDQLEPAGLTHISKIEEQTNPSNHWPISFQG